MRALLLISVTAICSSSGCLVKGINTSTATEGESSWGQCEKLLEKKAKVELSSKKYSYATYKHRKSCLELYIGNDKYSVDGKPPTRGNFIRTLKHIERHGITCGEKISTNNNYILSIIFPKSKDSRYKSIDLQCEDNVKKAVVYLGYETVSVWEDLFIATVELREKETTVDLFGVDTSGSVSYHERRTKDSKEIIHKNVIYNEQNNRIKRDRIKNKSDSW